jgi:hypothetical protein
MVTLDLEGQMAIVGIAVVLPEGWVLDEVLVEIEDHRGRYSCVRL